MYMETIRLKGPPNSAIIQPGSMFDCYATVVEEKEYWEVTGDRQLELFLAVTPLGGYLAFVVLQM